MITFFLASVRRGVRLFPQTQVLKDLFDDIRLVNEADDAPFGSPQGGETCMMDIGPDTHNSNTIFYTKTN